MRCLNHFCIQIMNFQRPITNFEFSLNFEIQCSALDMIHVLFQPQQMMSIRSGLYNQLITVTQESSVGGNHFFELVLP